MHVNKGFEMLIETKVPFSDLKLDDRMGMLQFFMVCCKKKIKRPMLHPFSHLYFSYWTLVDHPRDINYS